MPIDRSTLPSSPNDRAPGDVYSVVPGPRHIEAQRRSRRPRRRVVRIRIQKVILGACAAAEAGQLHFDVFFCFFFPPSKSERGRDAPDPTFHSFSRPWLRVIPMPAANSPAGPPTASPVSAWTRHRTRARLVAKSRRWHWIVVRLLWFWLFFSIEPTQRALDPACPAPQPTTSLRPPSHPPPPLSLFFPLSTPP